MARGRRAPEVDRIVPPRASTADFHAHTSRSDGLLAPEALVAAAIAAGVRTLAVTDHDTLAGYREVAAAAPMPAGFALIPGVEINAVSRSAGTPGGELHVVGLGVDPSDGAFEAALAEQRDQRRRRFWKMAARLREAGYRIDGHLEAVDIGRDDALGRPTLARALVAGGFATSVPDAFARLVGPGMPGYVPREGLDLLGAVAAIRAAGGLAILAHFANAPDHEALVGELIEAGLSGIETHHRSFDAATAAKLGSFAQRLSLVASGGTDFHGDEGTYAEAIAETWVPPEVAAGVLAAIGAGIGAPA